MIYGISANPSPGLVVLVLHLLPLLGDPLADASYGCLAHHIASSSGMLSGLKGLDLEALGIPTDTQYMEEYCANAGIPSMADTANFYLSFGFFRMAAILQGVYKRSLEGGFNRFNHLYLVIPKPYRFPPCLLLVSSGKASGQNAEEAGRITKVI